MGIRTISNSYNVKGDINEVFDLASHYVTALKYQISSAQKPNNIIAQRGSKLGSNFSTLIQNALTIVTISLSATGDGIQIIIQCNLHLGPLSVLTSGDRAYIENEIEMMKTFLITESYKLNTNRLSNITTQVESDVKPIKSETIPNYIVELENLSKLKEKGIITEDEYNAKKKKLLDI